LRIGRGYPFLESAYEMKAFTVSLSIICLVRSLYSLFTFCLIFLLIFSSSLVFWRYTIDLPSGIENMEVSLLGI